MNCLYEFCKNKFANRYVNSLLAKPFVILAGTAKDGLIYRKGLAPGENTWDAEHGGVNNFENQELPRDCPEIAQRTYLYIRDNSYATINQIHNALNISERTVKNHIALLRDKFIKRIGSDTKGHWEILSK